MQTEAIRLSAIVPASPQRVYDAWLDESTHAAITNLPASIDPEIGGKFTAGDGYITGETLWLERGRLIVQSWRTTDFPDDAPDSRLEVHLEKVEGGTRVVLDHRDLPAGQGKKYEEGWRAWYLEPMQAWFAEHGAEETMVDEEDDLEDDLLSDDADDMDRFSTEEEIAAAAAAELARAEDRERGIDRDDFGDFDDAPTDVSETAYVSPPRRKIAPRATAAKVSGRRGATRKKNGTGGARTAGARKTARAASTASRTARRATGTRRRTGRAATASGGRKVRTSTTGRVRKTAGSAATTARKAVGRRAGGARSGTAGRKGATAARKTATRTTAAARATAGARRSTTARTASGPGGRTTASARRSPTRRSPRKPRS